MSFTVTMQSNKIVSEGILASYSVWQFAPYGHPQPVGPTASIPVTEKATFLNLTRKGGFTDIYKPKKTYTFNRDATLYLNGPSANKITLASEAENDSVDFELTTSI